MWSTPRTTFALAAFNDLPVELIGAVVAEVVSIGDLLRLREVNHTFLNFATPRAFSTFHVVNTPSSVAGCAGLLQSNGLARLVKKLVVHCEAGLGENRLVNRGAPRCVRVFVGHTNLFLIID